MRDIWTRYLPIDGQPEAPQNHLILGYKASGVSTEEAGRQCASGHCPCHAVDAAAPDNHICTRESKATTRGGICISRSDQLQGRARLGYRWWLVQAGSMLQDPRCSFKIIVLLCSKSMCPAELQTVSYNTCNLLCIVPASPAA
jgi:hypothetical protein